MVEWRAVHVLEECHSNSNGIATAFVLSIQRASGKEVGLIEAPQVVHPANDFVANARVRVANHHVSRSDAIPSDVEHTVGQRPCAKPRDRPQQHVVESGRSFIRPSRCRKHAGVGCVGRQQRIPLGTRDRQWKVRA